MRTATLALSNVKIWFTDDNGTLIAGELYAKVIDTPPGYCEGFVVRFTSVPPAVSVFLPHALAASPLQTAA